MTPNNTVFACRVHDPCQFPLLDQALYSLRDCYPTDPVVVVCDGFAAATLELHLLTQHWDAELWVLPALKERKHGGRYVQTWLDIWRHFGTYYLVKFDPDTLFWRVSDVHLRPGLWGTVQQLGELRGVQGGCAVFSGGLEHWSLALYDMLSRRDLCPPFNAWEVPEVAQYTKKSPLIAEDWVLAWAVREAGLQVNSHPAINSHWSTPPIAAGGASPWAVTHPHKTVEIETGSPQAWFR